jgi:hypothetical protein
MEHNNKLKKFFKNKRVALIGPAPHIEKQYQKEYIDGFDTVVRMNWCYPVHDNVRVMTGNRCDVLYLHSWRADDGNLDGPLLMPHPDTVVQFNRFRNLNFIEKIDKEDKDSLLNTLKELESNIEKRPNMGLLAMKHILFYKPKELYVTGVTFFQTGGHHSGYICQVPEEDFLKDKGTQGTHHQPSQIKYFMENLADKIKPDYELKKIINEYRDNNSKRK